MGAASLQENEWGESDDWQNADSWEPADGNKKAHQLSIPYIIQITNSCTSAISNVDILDSYANRTSSTFGQSGSSAVNPSALSWSVIAGGGVESVISVVDDETELSIGVADWSVDFDTTLNLLVDSVNNNIAHGTPSEEPFGANSNNYTASYNATTNVFTITPPSGIGASYNGFSVSLAYDGGLWPHFVDPQTFSGGIDSTISIVPSSPTIGITYIEFLAQSESQPVRIGRTMIVSTSAGQLNQTVSVTHRDANGNRVDHVIPPIVDPYQNQTDRIIDDYDYLIDGYTRLRFNQINASATVFLYLFPISKFSATQLVAGRDAKKVFEPPYIVKAGLESLKLPKGVPPNAWNI